MQHAKTMNRRTPRRGFFAQVSAVMIQPVMFFRELPRLEETRQWLAAALLILMLIGFSAIQQTDTSTSVDMGGNPFEMQMDDSSSTGSENNWSTGLITAAGMLLIWGVQAFLLAEVTLFNGHSPQFGQNLQIAIWAAMPLALMALLQIIYISTGGEIGKAGLSGLIVDTDFYQNSSEFTRKLLIGVTSKMTVFWFWSLILLYWGAKHTLSGKWWSASLVVVIWIAVLTISPVISNQIDLTDYEQQQTQEMPTDDLFMPPMDGMPESEFP